MPPLWVGYLGGVLKDMGQAYTVIDAVGEGLNQKWDYSGGAWRGLSFKEILERLPEDADVIATSCMFTSSWPLVRDFLKVLKQERPNALLVVGGEHPSAQPEDVLAQTGVDLVVIGEGEATAREMFGRLQVSREQDWSGFEGVAWRDEAGQVRLEPRRPRIKDPDSIPMPVWDQIRVKDYMALGKGHGANLGPFMPLLGTRGCPYTCTFCASKDMWTTAWIPHSPARVAEEMARYHREFGATDFHFVDLTFVIKKSWALAFAEEIKKRELKITWQLPGGTRSEAFDEELAQALAESGLTNMSFAIESGDPTVLAQAKKKLNLSKQIQAAKAARKAGIRLFGFFIVGFPGETKASLRRTWLMVMRAAVIGYHEINICGFAPIPGTEDFRTLRAQNRLEVNEQYYHDLFNWATIGKQKSYCPTLSDTQIRRAVLFGMLSFFMLSWTLRPWRLWVELFDLTRGRKAKGKLIRFFRSYRELQTLQTVPVS